MKGTVAFDGVEFACKSDRVVLPKFDLVLPAADSRPRGIDGSRHIHSRQAVEDGTPRELIGGTGCFAQRHAAWRDSLV